MNEKNSFIVEKDGKKIKCDVLFTFDSEETGKHYMAYTDNTKDANGKIQVYANCYNPDEANPTLLPIETEKEYKMIEAVLETLQEEVQKATQGNGANE